VTVTASILHKTSSIETVYSNTSVNATTHVLGMKHVGGGRYQAIIPKQREGAPVQFEVHATDSLGCRRSTDPLSYSVGEAGFELPPFLSDTTLILGIIVAIIFVLLIL